MSARADRDRSPAEEVEALRNLAWGLAHARTLDEVAGVVTELAPPVLDAAFVSVAVERAGGAETHLINANGLPPDIAERWQAVFADAPSPLTEAIRGGEPIELDDLTALAKGDPQLLDDARRVGFGALAAYPVQPGATSLRAAIGIAWRQPRLPSGRDEGRLRSTLALCGAALQRAWSTDEMARLAALLDTLLRRAPIGLAFFDTELRFSHVNDALAETNGLGPEEHVGRSLREVVPGVADQAEPLLQRVLATGKPITGVEIAGETPAAPGQRRVWEESFYPVAIPGGRVIGVGAVANEVTTRRRAEASQRRLADMLRLATRISASGAYQWIPATGEVIWSEEYADLYGFPPDTPPSFEAWIDAVHPDDRPRLVALTEELLAGRDDWHTEFRVRHPAKGERWFHGVARVARRADGTVESVTGINTDITERKARELELARLHDLQRGLAERLQRGLLPAYLPALDGYDLAVRYAAGSDELRVGGDWYDVIDVRPDDCALVIGDVVGHDLDAAIAMSQLRNALAGLSHAVEEPSRVLDRLDDFVSHDPSLRGSTTFYARLRLAGGGLRYATAGHPPPLVVASSGSASLLEEGTGPPIGVAHGRRTTCRATLARGDLLVLYTDGLVEDRREAIDDSLGRLVREAVAHRALDVESLADHLLRCVPHGERVDDIALVVLRRR